MKKSANKAESQNIEWKEIWKDEYLKWICGFANAQGGKIYIGTDDDGNIIGVKNSKRLLEDIPNKIRDRMGIIADVNLLSKNDLDYIEISVNPSSYPISLNGEYYYRSGSTKSQLKGAALTEFLLKKTGYKWDSVTVDNVTIDDLDKESFDIFRREALKSDRMSEKDLKMSNLDLLDSLNLLENGKLKRAAVLLFHRNPEKWFTGSYIKIGKFGQGSDLRFQDEVHGSLFIQADRAMDLLFTKYLMAKISYKKDTRIEKFPYPREAIREALFNAIIHANRAELIPIQIRVEENNLCISNDCVFPEDWTAETLMQRHRSVQYNPNIANAFFRAGYVETWGRGIQKICEACESHGNPIPEYTVHSRDIMIKFSSNSKVSNEIPKSQNNETEDDLDEKILTILRLNNKVKQEDIAKLLDKSLSTIKRIMNKMIENGIITRAGGKRYGYWEINEK